MARKTQHSKTVWKVDNALCASAVEIARQQRALVPQFESISRCRIEVDCRKRLFSHFAYANKPIKCRVSQIEQKSKNNFGIHEHLRIVKTLSVFEIRCILGSTI